MAERESDLFSWQRDRQRDRGDGEGPKNAPLTVTQLNNLTRLHLEQKFGRITVVGEISNHKLHSSGHQYFSLKDSLSQIPAVLFRTEAARRGLRLRDGLEVVVQGQVTVFGKLGRLQIRVLEIEARGAGALQVAFEELKQRLSAEGLFAAGRKRLLPLVPRRVAVITSPQGAVIRDIVHVATRRCPNAQLLLVPTPTQGADAARPIAWALKRISRLAESLQIDVVIVARGGGSLEDLWGFNDESVARAIAACTVPVVSAVGHETDFTIADFVADERAPTPSAAAERVFPLRSELHAQVQRSVQRARRAVHRHLELERQHTLRRRARLGDGRQRVREASQTLMEWQHRAERAQRRTLAAARARISVRAAELQRLHPQRRLRGLMLRLQAARQRLPTEVRALLRARGRALPGVDALALATRRGVLAHRDRLAHHAARLDALSPLNVLARGYAIVTSARGVVTEAQQVSPGETVRVRVAQGDFRARVEKP